MGLYYSVKFLVTKSLSLRFEVGVKLMASSHLWSHLTLPSSNYTGYSHFLPCIRIGTWYKRSSIEINYTTDYFYTVGKSVYIYIFNNPKPTHNLLDNLSLRNLDTRQRAEIKI
jgi:hypothetical protein